MMALARGPGNGVFSAARPSMIYGVQVSGSQFAGRTDIHRMAVSWPASPAHLPLPARALRAVFEQDAARLQILADAIGFGEVAAPAGVLARLDRLLDLVDRHRRPLVLGAPQRQHAEHAVEVVERVADARRRRPALISRASIAVLIDAHEIEDRRQAGRGVEVVAQRGVERLTRRGHALGNRRVRLAGR